jgi:hypothetical protein
MHVRLGPSQSGQKKRIS